MFVSLLKGTVEVVASPSISLNECLGALSSPKMMPSLLETDSARSSWTMSWRAPQDIFALEFDRESAVLTDAVFADSAEFSLSSRLKIGGRLPSSSVSPYCELIGPSIQAPKYR